jgi:hypothetical membrane protein
MVAPIVAFTCILLAVTFYSPFSWTKNALSDLGIQTEPTSILFNFGLVASGVLTLVFGIGLFGLLGSTVLGKVGVFLFVLASLALIAIGVFNENCTPVHWYVSVVFFVSFSLSLFVLVAALLELGKLRMGLFTFIVAMFAATPWIAYFATRYVEGVAVPETISAFAASMWTMVLGFKMLKESSHSNM